MHIKHTRAISITNNNTDAGIHKGAVTQNHDQSITLVNLRIRNIMNIGIMGKLTFMGFYSVLAALGHLDKGF